MITYIIEDRMIIKKITNKDNYKKIIIHIDPESKTVKYENDYTLFELSEKLDYEIVKLFFEIN